jgi:hypothetical protein
MAAHRQRSAAPPPPDISDMVAPPDSPLPDFAAGLISLLGLLLVLGICSHMAKGVVLTVALQIFNVCAPP